MHENLDGFHFLTIAHNATMNMGMQKSYECPFFF